MCGTRAPAARPKSSRSTTTITAWTWTATSACTSIISPRRWDVPSSSVQQGFRGRVSDMVAIRYGLSVVRHHFLWPFPPYRQWYARKIAAAGEAARPRAEADFAQAWRDAEREVQQRIAQMGH